MPVAAGVDAFTAFERLLRTLCLNEFPCGTGSWRSSQGQGEPSSLFSVTTRDYGAENEQVETLEELVSSPFSPYSVDYTWSKEARQLRETAVKSPWLISKDFILNHFESLRIVDKSVNGVDNAMLQFPSLKELTLSANLLTTLDSKNLPRSLKVLELVANQISDLEPLCNQPPKLHHLGLSHNRISAVHDYITGEHWPTLLSLDLSYNNLTDLKDIIQKLLTLPKLRNLALIGNPLAFIPGYRGFTIDSLRSLTILDDTQISADEKHRFKGLARRRDFVRDEAQLVVKIQTVTGIPKPPELDITEEVPEYPITNRYYYVEFMFLEDFASKESKSLEEGEKDEGKEEAEKKEDEEEITTENEEGQVDNTPIHENGNMNTDVQSNGSVPVGTFFTALESQAPSVIPPEDEGEEEDLPALTPELKLSSYRTQGVQWTEESAGTLEMAFNQELIIDDLPALKQCLRQGFQIAVKEDKILSYPPEETDDRQSQASQKKGGKEKGDKKEKPKDAKGDKGGKKKKKEPEIELVHSPPEVSVLGTYTLDLEEFINGEHIAQEICTCHVTEKETIEEEVSDKAEDKKEKKKKGSGMDVVKGKKGNDGKEKDKGKKPAKLDKMDSKAKLSSAKAQIDEEGEEEEPPPPPLTVAVRVELVKWSTAQDSIPKTEPTEQAPQ
ncbi:Leucine-rich repeat-containing protein 43 [Holothuria leucospilota]|uniref:Leucine-rich repeat-containing protein 43 n=1 Tax=Holothuria leucospilota TaxID=206669 RepID=A0A9Q1CF14_HOLLE|nr:Leucine-rich repeat-containing protein 43 [Holothuria leucospilota]